MEYCLATVPLDIHNLDKIHRLVDDRWSHLQYSVDSGVLVTHSEEFSGLLPGPEPELHVGLVDIRLEAESELDVALGEEGGGSGGSRAGVSAEARQTLAVSL